ncbi:Arm DNA-binding domain-containing protein [Chitinophaga niabensis]|uniref:Arm DNA-binding domain-containing protein n=1 Tax=Chitinophaga niabensis TaxID=536979 RepID=A0A1N6K2R1_9BACT|nr:Arm DNA-binding domain-containing protein [Chitinophaga niabensis]SIO50868.1 hypothetical protein SAMN04488055_4967 [Chitinophaga niabensis]
MILNAQANTFDVHFLTRKSRSTKGMCDIFARITMNGQPKESAIKAEISAKDWNRKKGQPKSTTPELKKLEEHLDTIKARMFTHYHGLENKGRRLM